MISRRNLKKKEKDALDEVVYEDFKEDLDAEMLILEPCEDGHQEAISNPQYR